ncbi:TonB-dependent receptor [Sphingomonas sp. C8-2]|nr:TonB-dependent receptor [Sphingomonas sp. C8-2]
MTERRKFLLCGVAVCICLAMQGGIASAQVQATADMSADGNGLGDIVVTAQKRAQTLQSVPVAATALTSEALQQKGISTLVDIASVAPSLNVTTSYGNTAPEITLRGVGAASFDKNVETTVATYLDEVVLNLSTSKLGQLFDLERVEVLRGPQGTLYGKNSTGGAINFVSKRPDGTTAANGALTVARYGTYDVSLGAQTALTDALSVRVSGVRRYSDGYSFNTLTGKHLNDADDWAGRLGVRYKDAGVDAYLKLFFDRSTTNGVAYYPGGVNVDGSPRPDGSNRVTGYVPPADIDIVAAQPTPSKVRNHGATLNIDVELGDLTLTSVSGYLHSKGDYRFDADESPFDIVKTNHLSKGHQISQELRLASPDDGPFTWMIGASFFRQKQDGALLADFLGLGITTRLDQSFVERSTSYAGFVDGTYRFSDRLDLFAGIRLTNDRKKIRQIGTGNFVPTVPASYDLSGKASWTKPSYRIGLNFTPARGTLIYASYNRGYRSGEYDVGFITNTSQIARPVAPEYVDNYEAGLKASAFDNHLRLSTAAFYTVYKDQQLSITPPGGICCSRVNAGKARVYGIEAEGLARFGANFDLTFSGTLLDTKYLDFRPDANRDFSGKPLGRAPKYQLRLAPEYRHPVGSGEVFLAPEVQFTGKQRVQTTVDAYGEDIQRAYTVVNGQVGYRDGDGRYSAFFFIKNATNKRYMTYFANVGATAVNQTFYSPPRTFGVTLTGNF